MPKESHSSPFWRGKRVLITGISGFVGTYLAQALHIAGAWVAGTTRNKSNTQHINIPIDVYETDLMSLPDLSEVMDAAMPDVVFHLAAQSSVFTAHAQPYETTIVNITTLATVLEALRVKRKQATLVMAGSADVYGGALSPKGKGKQPKTHSLRRPASTASPYRLPIPETAPLHPLSPYAVSRVHNELLVQNYVSLYGLRAIITRSFNHEGAGRGQHFVTSSIIRQVKEMTLSGGQRLSVGNVMAFRDWSHVKDTVEAYLLLAEKGKSGEAYNVGSGRTTSVLSLLLLALHEGFSPVRRLAACNGKKTVENPLSMNRAKVFGVSFPKTHLDFLLLTGKLHYDLRDKALRVETAAGEVEIVLDPSRFRPADIPVLFADISKLRRLGFKPNYSLQDIVRDMTAAQG